MAHAQYLHALDSYDTYPQTPQSSKRVTQDAYPALQSHLEVGLCLGKKSIRTLPLQGDHCRWQTRRRGHVVHCGEVPVSGLTPPPGSTKTGGESPSIKSMRISHPLNSQSRSPFAPHHRFDRIKTGRSRVWQQVMLSLVARIICNICICRPASFDLTNDHTGGSGKSGGPHRQRNGKSLTPRFPISKSSSSALLVSIAWSLLLHSAYVVRRGEETVSNLCAGRPTAFDDHTANVRKHLWEPAFMTEG